MMKNLFFSLLTAMGYMLIFGVGYMVVSGFPKGMLWRFFKFGLALNLVISFIFSLSELLYLPLARKWEIPGYEPTPTEPK